MEQFFKAKMKNNLIWVIVIFLLMMIGALIYYQWPIGILAAILLVVLTYAFVMKEQKIQQEVMDYLNRLSTEVDFIGEEIFLNMPIGIIVYDEAYKIKWANPYLVKLNRDQLLLGKSLKTYSEDILKAIKNKEKSIWIQIDKVELKLYVDYAHRTLYLFNRSEEKYILTKYENERLVFANICLDNYEEISNNMSDSVKSYLNSVITSTLNRWAEENHFYLKRTSQDRFIAVLTQQTLDQIETTRFSILEDMKKINVDEVQRSPVTLSIGVGTGDVFIPELAQMAQASLDLALGRGGDQVVIREESGKVRFYGGKTNPMEKRTRVRARVISHALKELVKESDNVIIMGHRSPDMDSLGASIGVLNIAKSNEVPAYIIYNEKDILTGISRVINKIQENEVLWSAFISPEEAESLITSKTLVVVVDTHRPHMTAYQSVLEQARHKVVIDHHRRGDDFIENPTLVYMEPYASSTSELVTELIEYQPKKKPLSSLEATALLAGIIVDTNSFALRTGSRTFDAASYLRAKGADPILVQELLKEDLDTVVARNQLIEKADIYFDQIAISIGEEDRDYNQIIIAQAADSLLSIDKIEASFVIAKQGEDRVSISARSLGEVNVQVVMEEMNGGGHLTNAATQVKDKSLTEVKQMLIDILTNYFEEEVTS